MMELPAVAKLCYENVRCFAKVFGDHGYSSWDELSDDKRNDLILDVRSIINDPNITASELHDIWVRRMVDRGWTYGPVKDSVAMTRPDICAYEFKTPIHQQELRLIICVVRIAASC